MKVILLVSLGMATALAVSEAIPDEGPGAVPLILNPDYKHNTPAQIHKMNRRYPNMKIKGGNASTGKVGLVNVSPDLEYYGAVKVGTPGQTLRLNFDSGSSDIWFPSTSCSSKACKAHTRFNPAKSSTYKKDGRPWKIGYGDGSTANGILGSDIVNVGGIKLRQTVGLATNESSQFASSPEDGLFGLGFNTLQSVKGVKTFMDNALALSSSSSSKKNNSVLRQPVVSVFLPSYRRNGGRHGHVLFGSIDHSRYLGKLHYVPVTHKGFWQIKVDAVKIPTTTTTTKNAATDVQFATPKQEVILDTGTTLIVLSDAAAKKIHKGIKGAVHDPNLGWLVPCSLRHPTTTSSPSSKNNDKKISFKLNGKYFDVPLADLAYEAVDGDVGKTCLSGIQGGQEGLWILGDVFIKNNYCVFDHSLPNPRVGLAPLKY
ncbi:hypothetical protein BGX29_010300 [Mortierella sp. GBA35]|nr:hypothetical protein BGX29_010300 [Mortierella sp. GBA35]KAG0202678.1 hypothetical protein BGX33_009545 [Mortierella sp. NVP41]